MHRRLGQFKRAFDWLAAGEGSRYAQRPVPRAASIGTSALGFAAYVVNEEKFFEAFVFSIGIYMGAQGGAMVFSKIKDFMASKFGCSARFEDSPSMFWRFMGEYFVLQMTLTGAIIGAHVFIHTKAITERYIFSPDMQVIQNSSTPARPEARPVDLVSNYKIVAR